MLIAFIAVGTITPSTIHAERETLKVGTDTNYVSFEFLDQETGEYVGFDIDLMAAIVEVVGFDYELEPMLNRCCTCALG